MGDTVADDLAGCRVAIVEQHAEIRELLVTSLARAGCDVVFACATRPHVVRLVSRYRPDVLLIDAVAQHTVLREIGAFGELVMMTSFSEEMDGFELVRALHQQHPELRILAWSSTEGREALYRALWAGADDFLEQEHPTVASILRHLRPLCQRA